MKNNILNVFGFFLFLSVFQLACSGGVKKDYKAVDLQEVSQNQSEVHGTEIKEDEIKFSNPLNADMIKSGQNVYDLKCMACHKLTDERLVGPGWAGVTKNRKPVWIMNMITNVDMMLETDPEAQKLLELCLVRMPNQNVTKEQARDIIEFMRKNDGEQ